MPHAVIFLLKVTLATQDFSWFHTKFGIVSHSFVNNVIVILIGISQICRPFWAVWTFFFLKILILPVHEHRMSFQYFYVLFYSLHRCLMVFFEELFHIIVFESIKEEKLSIYNYIIIKMFKRSRKKRRHLQTSNSWKKLSQVDLLYKNVKVFW
jgi:hypothetical protein